MADLAAAISLVSVRSSMEEEKPLRNDTHVLCDQSRLGISNGRDPRATMPSSGVIAQLIYPASEFV
jgi:hypothetical protein